MILSLLLSDCSLTCVRADNIDKPEGAITEPSSTEPSPPPQEMSDVPIETTVPEFDISCFTSFDSSIPLGDVPLPDAITDLEFTPDFSSLLPPPDVLPDLFVQSGPPCEMPPFGQDACQDDILQDNVPQSGNLHWQCHRSFFGLNILHASTVAGSFQT